MEEKIHNFSFEQKKQGHCIGKFQCELKKVATWKRNDKTL